MIRTVEDDVSARTFLRRAMERAEREKQERLQAMTSEDWREMPVSVVHGDRARVADAETRAARVAKVTELHSAGMNDVEIAAQMGARVDAHTVYRIRQANGLPANDMRGKEGQLAKRKRGTAEIDARIVALHRIGMTDREIAWRICYSRQFVMITRHRLGLEPNKRKESA
jgi:hypothetical protein